MARFRVIDTGLRGARENIAFDCALLESHKAGAIPDTIRFLRFRPSALVGRHQALSREVHVAHCRAHGVETARRITGGGAIYFDQGQVGWELVFHRDSLALGGLADVARGICEAAAAGLSTLGIDARFRPRNDIEVGGRKLCGTGGFFDGDTLFYQGTVLIDTDPAAMVAALNVPQAKLARRGLDSAAARVVTLRELLGADTPGIDVVCRALLDGFVTGLGIEVEPGSVGLAEERLAARLLAEEIGTEDFVAEIDDPASAEDVLAASHTGPGGTVTAFVRLEGATHDRVREVLITGDFFVTPPRTIYDLEAALRGVAVADVGATVEQFFATAEVDLLTVRPADFRAAVEAAVASGAPGAGA
ncbi:MAG: lipoate--protein ligase family protein [Ectothiorhodospiraceae bacterium]|nr:lipoate--protein ligase family protein [Ectothiorhodospiraceae bacterium]